MSIDLIRAAQASIKKEDAEIARQKELERQAERDQYEKQERDKFNNLLNRISSVFSYENLANAIRARKIVQMDVGYAGKFIFRDKILYVCGHEIDNPLLERFKEMEKNGIVFEYEEYTPIHLDLDTCKEFEGRTQYLITMKPPK